MKNITTTNDLKIAIQAIVAAYELNDTIDERYNLEWLCVESDFFFSVTYLWTKGITEDSENDPTISRDSEFEAACDSFVIYKTDGYKELAKEVTDAISNVTSKEFEVLKFSETI